MAARQGISVQQVRETALEDDGPATSSGEWPDINHVIGDFDDVGIMFNHNDTVTFITQLLQEFIQAVYVARVHSDAGFVKDIQDIHKAAAQVFDHLNALRLAARQCIGCSIQAEVFQANIDHLLEPLDQRVDHWRGDGIFDRPDDLDQFINFHRRQLRDVVPIDLATERRLAESRAFTEGTWPVSHVGRYRFLRALGHGFHVARDVLVAELIDNAFKGHVDRFAGHLHLDFVGFAVEEQIHLFFAVVVQLFVVIEQPRLG